MSDSIVDKKLLGRVWITLSKEYKKKFNLPITKEQVEIFYRKPKWYNVIYDPTNEKSGEVLLSYALLDKSIAG